MAFSSRAEMMSTMEEGELSDEGAAGKCERLSGVATVRAGKRLAIGRLSSSGRRCNDTLDGLQRSRNSKTRSNSKERENKGGASRNNGSKNHRRAERVWSSSRDSDDDRKRHKNGSSTSASRRRILCKFFKEGHCKHGSSCTFSHDKEGGEHQDLACKYFKQGFCRRGFKCAFSHVEPAHNTNATGEGSQPHSLSSSLPSSQSTQLSIDQSEDDLSDAHQRRRALIAYNPELSSCGIPSLLDKCKMSSNNNCNVAAIDRVAAMSASASCQSCVTNPSFVTAISNIGAQITPSPIQSPIPSVSSQLAQIMVSLAPITSYSAQPVFDMTSNVDKSDFIISMLRKYVHPVNERKGKKRNCYGFLVDGCEHLYDYGYSSTEFSAQAGSRRHAVESVPHITPNSVYVGRSHAIDHLGESGSKRPGGLHINGAVPRGQPVGSTETAPDFNALAKRSKWVALTDRLCH